MRHTLLSAAILAALAGQALAQPAPPSVRSLGGMHGNITCGTGVNCSAGTISASGGYTLPTASATTLGGIKPDGSTVTVNAGTGVASIGTVPAAQVSGLAAAAAAAAPVQTVAGRSGNVTISLGDVAGAGGAAALNVGTGAGTVAAGNDSRIAGALQAGAIPAAPGQLLGGSGSAGTAAAITLSADFSLSGGTLGIVSTIPPAGLVASTGAATVTPTLSGLSFSGSTLSLAAPGTSTMGGVQANAGSAGQFVNGISASTGALTYGTPAVATSSVAGTVKPDAVTTVVNSGVLTALGVPVKSTGWPHTGQFYLPDGIAGAVIGTSAPLAGRFYAESFYIPASGASLKTLNMNFTVAPTAGSWSGCIYQDNGAGQPGNLVAGSDTGNGSNATTASTGVKTLTYAGGLTLTGPAWYWASMAFASATGTMNIAGVNATIEGQGAITLGQTTAALAISGGYPAYYSTTTTTYGACPSSFGTVAAVAAAPIIAMGY